MILKVQKILTKVVNRMIKKYQPKLHDSPHPSEACLEYVMLY